LKGSKHSLQHHPHDAAMMNAHSFVSMAVEAMCHPCHSAAHCRHMKRQPSLSHCHPRRGRRHCNCRCRCRLCLRCQLRCHCHCCRPLLLSLPSAIAVAVTVNHHRRHLCCVAVSHCHRRCPCCQPLPSPSPSAITVAISVGHHHRCCCWPFPRVVAFAQ
jgi:hypothetical protein